MADWSIAVFRTEMAKQVRRPRTYVALGITVALPVIMAVALNANPPDGGCLCNMPCAEHYALTGTPNR